MKSKNELNYKDLKIVCSEDNFKFETTAENNEIKKSHMEDDNIKNS